MDDKLQHEYDFNKIRYESALEIFRHSKRLKDDLMNRIMYIVTETVKEECQKRFLNFEDCKFCGEEFMYDYTITVNGNTKHMDMSNSINSLRKNIRLTLNKIIKNDDNYLPVRGDEYEEAKRNNTLVLDNDEFGYIYSPKTVES